MSKISLKSLTLTLVLIATALGHPQPTQAEINLEPGHPAPGFYLMDFNGKEHFLSDYVGKPRTMGKPPPRRPVLLNFFGVTCKPCEAEIPYLQKLTAQYQQDGLELILVSQDPAFAVQDYVAKRQLEMTVLLDAYGQVNRKYLVSGIPVLYLIGPDGNIVLRRFGFDHRDNAQLELALRRLFAKPVPVASATPSSPKKLPPKPSTKPASKPTPKPKGK